MNMRLGDKLEDQGFKYAVSWHNAAGLQITYTKTKEEAETLWWRLEKQGYQPTIS